MTRRRYAGSFGAAAEKGSMSEKEHERRFHGDPRSLRSDERLARLEVDRVVKLSIDGLAPKRVLDVGTGTGIFAEAFATKGIDVVGIDANGTMLEEARRLVPDATFEESQAEEIPYGDGEFDLAFMGLLLHETDDPVRALGEARRVSMSRVVVLEWPYERDGHGPPLEHRFGTARILEIAEQAGLGRIDFHRLSRTVLFRMAVEPAGTPKDGR
jgi:ubiquinone/menaquinone biosynthesis C-methylase UbiE